MQGIVTPLIYVLAFVAVVTLVQVIAGLFFSSRDRTRRVNRRLTMLESGMKPDDVYAALVRTRSNVTTGNVHVDRIVQGFLLYCRQADLSISPLRLLAIVGGAAAAIWLVSRSLFGSALGANPVLYPAISFGIAVSGAWIWLSRRRNARAKLLEEQLPLAIDIVNRGLRAGHPVTSAIQLAANELGDPIGSEFGLVVDESTYGLELREALANLARRTGSRDAHFLAVSVGIQTQTGGNLAEILEGLANVIRGRVSLGKRVKALSSEGRASAMILSALPPLLVGFIGLTSPTYYTSKFADPIFWPVVAGVCALYAVGRVMMYRITHFKY